MFIHPFDIRMPFSQIKRAIARRDAELPSRIIATVRDGRERRVLR